MWSKESNKPMISVKASLEGELRRFSLERPVAYAQLFEKVQLVFGLKENVAVQYLDDEGDYVGLSCDFELEEALRICESSLSQKANLFRIKIVPMAETPAPKHQFKQTEQSVDLKVKGLKLQLKEERIRHKEKLKEKIQLERFALKQRMQEKQCAFKQDVKKVREESKLQRNECKKKMNEQIQGLKQLLHQEKLSFQQQVKTIKQQFQEQHKEDLNKIKAQQGQLNALLVGRNEQQLGLESGIIEETEKTVAVTEQPEHQRSEGESTAKPIVQHDPLQQGNSMLMQLQFDPLQLQNVYSGDIRLVKLLHKQIKNQLKMEVKAQKKLLKEAKKKENTAKPLEVA